MSDSKKKEEELLQTEAAVQDTTDYALLRDSLLQELLDTPEFTFDLNADALYQQYRNSYMRQGREAAGDAFGKAASLTGGYANSYAQTVAAQTYDDYMLALQDKGMQIYENAYDRYTDENERKAALYKSVKEREETQYERQKDEENTAYNRQQAEEKLAYDRLQDAEDEKYKKEQDLLSFAYKMAQLGDLSYLKSMGVDVSALEAIAKEKENEPEKISVSIQNGAEETYYTYGYVALLAYLNRQIAYGQLTEKGKNQIIKALTTR